MVSIGVNVPPVSPRVSLASLLAVRDASIAITPSLFALAATRAKRTLGAARSGARGAALLLVTLFSLLAALTSRHGLVVGGLVLFVLAAAQVSLLAALITAGVALFFLELRRR